MPKATNVVTLPSETTAPQMTVNDMRMLTGPLTREYEGVDYWTIRGKMVSQLYKDAAFSAFAFKDENDKTPVHNSSAERDAIEGGTSPYKDKAPLPEMAGKKMRHDLVFDCINDFEKDPKVVEEQCKHIRKRALREWCQYKAADMRKKGDDEEATRNKVAAKVVAGAPNLTEVDASWDEAFITKAAHFITGGNRKVFTFGEDDVSNLNLIKSVLAGRLPEQASAAVSLDDVAI